jgi:hypothetical protein
MTFRLERSDVENWQSLASKAKLTLSEWIRRKCNGEASNLTAAAEKRGMTPEWLAEQIFNIINDVETLPRDKVTALKTLIAARGEQTGEKGSSTQVVNLKTPKALIIMGTDPTAVSKMIGKGS